MDHFNFIEKLQVLINHIGRQQTGNPDKFAKRLSMSRSALYDILEELKSRGIDIRYSRARRSFYFCNNVKVDFRFEIIGLEEMDAEEMKNTNGGCNFFASVQYIGRKNRNFAVENHSADELSKKFIN